jgi:Ca-activated chloride channel homolog
MIEHWWHDLREIRFAEPSRLWWLIAVVVAIASLEMYTSWQRRACFRTIGDPLLLARLSASVSARRRRIKALLLTLGVGCLVVALARPQREERQPVEVHGLDVVIALDASKSMMVNDVKAPEPSAKSDNTRLERARAYALALIEALPGDRIAPMVFASATAHFPLTLDAEAAAAFLLSIGPADIPQGSDLALTVKAGRCLLRPDLYDKQKCSNVTGRRGNGGSELWTSSNNKDKSKAPKLDDEEQEIEERGKVMVLITDGGDSVESVKREVEQANELGIAVFVVGMGSEDGGLVFDIDDNGRRTTAKHDKQGKSIVSRRDSAGLSQIVGAQRYIAEAGSGPINLDAVITALKQSARGKAWKQIRRPTDMYAWFAFAGLLLLMAELLVSERRRSLYPEAP